MKKLHGIVVGCFGVSSVALAGGGACSPDLISKIPMVSGEPVDLALSDQVGLVAQESGEIMVFDVSSGQLELVATLDRPVVKEMLLVDDYLFALYDNASSIEVISFVDPQSPQSVAQIDLPDEIFDFEIQGDELYAAAGPEGVRVYDVNDPTVPFQKGMLAGVDANRVSVSGVHVLADVLENGNRTGRLYDFTDPTNPVFVSQPGPTGMYLFEDSMVQTQGDFGYIEYDYDLNTIGENFSSSSTYDGFEKFDDSLWFASSHYEDQAPSMIEVWGRCFGGANDCQSHLMYLVTGNTRGMTLAPHAGRLLVANSSGVWLADADSGPIDYQPSSVTDFVLYGDTLLWLNRNGIVRYDLSDPAAPVRLGAVYMSDTGGQMLNRIEHADGFVAISMEVDTGWIPKTDALLLGDETMQRIPGSPARFDSIGSLSYVAADGRRFALRRPKFQPAESGFYEFDKSDNLVVLGGTDAIDFGNRIVMRGDLLVTLNNGGDLAVYDLSVPSSIATIGMLNGAATGGNLDLALVSAQTAAVSDTGMVRIYDISDPSQIQQVSDITYAEGFMRSVYSADGMLGIMRRTGGAGSDDAFELYDMSDPSNPIKFEEQHFAPGRGLARFDTSRRIVAAEDGLEIYSACAAGCPADFDGDGTLSFLDVSGFLDAFNSSDPIADLNDDGIFNFFDVSDFLVTYSAGCP